MLQEMIKGINAMVEYKSSVELEKEEEDYTSTEVSNYKTFATKNSGELKGDGSNRNEYRTIKETQHD